jgi:transcriptional regulator with XRE-family HTH domain
MCEFRHNRGWNLADMNRASGVGITTLKNLEAGDGRPRIDTCHRIAAALGRSVGDVWPVPPELVGATFDARGRRIDGGTE